MAVFSNNRLVHASIVGFVIFMLLGAAAWYFQTSRISTPERQENPAPPSSQK